MSWSNKQSSINNYCCWCRKDIPENSPVYGLTAKFRKDVETLPIEDKGKHYKVRRKYLRNTRTVMPAMPTPATIPISPVSK